MTAQICDNLKYKNNRYIIIKRKPYAIFSPKKYGLNTIPAGTANRRGFYCQYTVESERLVLDDLNINAFGFYPELNGVKPNVRKAKGFATSARMAYRNVNLPMNYTGRILAGNNQLSYSALDWEYYIPWSFERLEEFVFEEGKLTAVIDYGESACKIRCALKAHPEIRNLPYEQRNRFIKNLFHPEQQKSLWWLG